MCWRTAWCSHKPFFSLRLIQNYQLSAGLGWRAACLAGGIREQASGGIRERRSRELRVHGFATKTKALAREIPPATQTSWRDAFICSLIIQTRNTSEVGLVFLMYCLTLSLLRNYCPSWAFFVGLGFYFFTQQLYE